MLSQQSNKNSHDTPSSRSEPEGGHTPSSRRGPGRGLYRRFFKRFLDFWIALVALICLSPILLVVTVWLHFANKGAGAFFLQERPGKDAKIFKIIKFKTMNDEKDESGNLLPNDKRITKIGSILRSSSIDELPQLINVLRGDMALIGPRPLMPRYLKLYSSEQARRHDVRPGITGWAQVNGRNAITWTDKFKLDVWYVDHCTFLLDCKIIYKTIVSVIKRKDIEYDGNSLNSEGFNGHN